MSVGDEKNREYHRNYDKKYYQRPDIKEHVKNRGKLYRQRPEIKEHRKKLWDTYKQKPEVMEHIKKYNQEEKRKIAKRAYNSKPEIKERRKVYQKEHDKIPEVKEAQKKYKSEYRKNHLFMWHNCQYKRRAITKTTDITSQWLKVLWDETTHCVECGKQMENHSKYPDGRHLDHVIPLCLGGLHLTNNVRYICAKCNLSRPKNGSDINQTHIKDSTNV
jgi:hypothetical protein